MKCGREAVSLGHIVIAAVYTLQEATAFLKSILNKNNINAPERDDYKTTTINDSFEHQLSGQRASFVDSIPLTQSRNAAKFSVSEGKQSIPCYEAQSRFGGWTRSM